MRAAADELLAWEALMDSFSGMCAGVGSVPTPFLALSTFA